MLCAAGPRAAQNALCFVVMDAHSDCVLVGRADRRGQRFLTAALPIRKELTALLGKWNEVMADAAAQMKLLDNKEELSKWSTKESAAWSQRRAEADSTIHSLLGEIEKLFGPWRLLLSGTECNSVPEEGGEIDSLAAQLSHVTIASAVGKTKTAKTLSKSKPTAANQDELISVARVGCKPWVDFLLSSVDLGSAPASGSCELLTRQEAQTALAAVIADWDRSLTAAEATAAAAQIVKECYATNSRADSGSAEETEPTPVNSSSTQPAIDYSSLTIPGLKQLVKERGLESRETKALKKAELVALLTRHDQGGAAVGKEVSLGKKSSAGSKSELASGQTLAPCGHTVLILDEALQEVPWECMPSLRTRSVSRMPSLSLLLDAVPTDSSEFAAGRTVAADKAWYALDIEGNLATCRAVMEPFLQSYAQRWQWTGFVGEIPSRAELQTHHEQSDLFVYCGHNAGEDMGETHRIKKFSHCPASLLWGCSSGRLRAMGVHDPSGAALHYLQAGAPFVVGNLWNVTSRDINNLGIECMGRALPPVGDTAASTNRVEGETICSALVSSRDICKYKHVVGDAPVVYGLPYRFTA